MYSLVKYVQQPSCTCILAKANNIDYKSISTNICQKLSHILFWKGHFV